MKKMIYGVVAGIVSLITLLSLCGCNQQVFDTTYYFKTAIIEMPGGEVITVEIQSWCDYDGEQLQIKTKDGTTYLVNSTNCVMIA